jgi:hydrogenase expression/formation protein HypC
MSLGTPARICEIIDAEAGLAWVETGVERVKVDISCLLLEQTADQLMGRWTIIDQGFAHALIDEEHAEETLALLAELRLDRNEPEG